MKITKIESTDLVTVPFTRSMTPAWSPGGIWRELSWVVTRVHTDQGITGITAAFGPPTDTVTEYLVGKDPFATEQHIQVLRHAKGDWPISIALWDIIGQAAGLPLYKLWGGYQDRVKAYASLIEMRSPQETADLMQRFVSEGYRAVKLRLHAHTVEEDISVVEAAREAVGDQVVITVDANQTFTAAWPRGGPVWSYERALETARQLEQLDVLWLEEPLARYDFENLARLSDATKIRIAGGEANAGFHEFRWMIEQNVYDVVQADAIYSEGFSQLRKIAAMAEMRNKWFIPHNGISGVGMAAHLQLSAAIPNCPYLEYMYDPPGCPVEVFQSLLSEPLTIDSEGFVPVPQRPGLGVELNDDLLASHWRG